MPSVYTPDATNTTQPALTDYAYILAEEVRTLKSYIQSTIIPMAGGTNGIGYKNKIINGNFDLENYDAGGSVGNLNGYGLFDRWRHSYVGSANSLAQVSFTPGQTDVPGEPTYYLRAGATPVVGASNYARSEQRIESVRTLAGQQCTLSFYAKASTGTRDISVELVQNFGTGGSAEVNASVNSNLVSKKTLTTTWTKYTFTVTLPSITGKTIGTSNDDYLGVLFWYDAGSSFNTRTNSLGQGSSTNVHIAQVQVAAGNAATTFDNRPKHVELAMAQRYFERVSSTGGGVCFAIPQGSAFQSNYFYKVPKRGTTTFSLASAQGASWQGATPSSIILGTDFCTFYHVSTAFYMYNTTAGNAMCYFSSEL